MIIKKKVLSVLLLILYIIVFIYLLSLFKERRENFIGFLDLLNFGNVKHIIKKPEHKNEHKNEKEKEREEKEIRKKEHEEKYIYILPKILNNNNIQYFFYNKDNERYMILDGEFSLKKIFFDFKDNKNRSVGKLDKMYHNKFTISLSAYSQPMNIEFHNNYFNATCYIENDNHLFYVKYLNKNLKKKKNDSGTAHIFLNSYKLKIGDVHKENDKFKIKTENEYKNYLNLFAITYICLHQSQ